MTEREVINPHDAIFISFDDPEAAQMAVVVVGKGAYAIAGEDGVPLMLLEGDGDKWVEEKYGMSLRDWLHAMPRPRLAAALRSMRLRGRRSSMSDPVGRAHAFADAL